ncbi:hypothetical protein PsorP6_015391 [Peronosclerospora sorghi]|uniref:Uncharacterized protein n=1 Tax=Peronosclerospora sorghi TaxID=230839 RepID=A0ACC0WQV1_9STRA|nr:hypothetical protein PsorP6_015391 [Peronosclerospora sorghi]
MSQRWNQHEVPRGNLDRGGDFLSSQDQIPFRRQLAGSKHMRAQRRRFRGSIAQKTLRTFSMMTSSHGCHQIRSANIQCTQIIRTPVLVLVNCHGHFGASRDHETRRRGLGDPICCAMRTSHIASSRSVQQCPVFPYSFHMEQIQFRNEVVRTIIRDDDVAVSPIPVTADSEMMEVDEDARDNMEVDEEGYDSVSTVREQMSSNNYLNLLPVATVNTVQQPIREQMPVERRPQLPPSTEQQQLGYERELSDAIVFRPPIEGLLVFRRQVFILFTFELEVPNRSHIPSLALEQDLIRRVQCVDIRLRLVSCLQLFRDCVVHVVKNAVHLLAKRLRRCLAAHGSVKVVMDTLHQGQFLLIHLEQCLERVVATKVFPRLLQRQRDLVRELDKALFVLHDFHATWYGVHVLHEPMHGTSLSSSGTLHLLVLLRHLSMQLLHLLTLHVVMVRLECHLALETCKSFDSTRLFMVLCSSSGTTTTCCSHLASRVTSFSALLDQPQNNAFHRFNVSILLKQTLMWLNRDWTATRQRFETPHDFLSKAEPRLHRVVGLEQDIPLDSSTLCVFATHDLLYQPRDPTQHAVKRSVRSHASFRETCELQSL